MFLRWEIHNVISVSENHGFHTTNGGALGGLVQRGFGDAGERTILVFFKHGPIFVKVGVAGVGWYFPRSPQAAAAGLLIERSHGRRVCSVTVQLSRTHLQFNRESSNRRDLRTDPFGNFIRNVLDLGAGRALEL